MAKGEIFGDWIILGSVPQVDLPMGKQNKKHSTNPPRVWIESTSWIALRCFFCELGMDGSHILKVTVQLIQWQKMIVEYHLAMTSFTPSA